MSAKAPTAHQLAMRRELLVATSQLQRLQLRHELRHGPWHPTVERVRRFWRLARLVRSWLRP